MPRGMIGAPPFMPPNGMGMPGQMGPQGMPMGGQMPPHPPMMPAFPPMPPSPPQAPQQQGGPQPGGQPGGPQQPDPWAGGINPSLTALLPPPGAGPNPGFGPPATSTYGAPEPSVFQPPFPPIQPTPIATGGGVGYHWPPTTAGVPIDPGALVGIPLAKGPDGMEELLPAEASLSPWRSAVQQTPIVGPGPTRPPVAETAQQLEPQPIDQTPPQVYQGQTTPTPPPAAHLIQQQAVQPAQQQAAQLAQQQAAQLAQQQVAQLAEEQVAQLARSLGPQLAQQIASLWAQLPAPQPAPAPQPYPTPTALIPAPTPNRPSLPPVAAASPTDGTYSTRKSWHARKSF